MSKLGGKIGKNGGGATGIRGVDTFMRNLHAVLLRKKALAAAGLIQAAAFIRREMDTTPPLIPVDTGNLRASWYTRLNGKKDTIGIGFTAKYAAMVHERDWKKGKRPGSGPKFFESALKRNKDNIRKIIAQSARQ